MSTVIMPNDVRIFIGGDDNKEIQFHKLISNLDLPAKQKESFKILSNLGGLAKRAIPSLERILHHTVDQDTMNEIYNTLERLDPMRYCNGTHNHMTIKNKKDKKNISTVYEKQDIYRRQVVGGGGVVVPSTAIITPSPSSSHKTVSHVEIIQKDCVVLDNDAFVTRRCNFCEKETTIGSDFIQSIAEKLSPPKRFYCSFCLRGGYHTRNSKDILILTFRGIIGYYFYEFFRYPKNPSMWQADIQDYVAAHAKIGLQNPVFNYDPESFCWFIDFGKIGNTKKKLPIESVHSTIITILASFNLHMNVRYIQMHKLYAKYQEAVKDFHEKRYRPTDKRICSPTLKGCGSIDWCGSISTFSCAGKPSIDDTRNFCPDMFVKKPNWKHPTH